MENAIWGTLCCRLAGASTFNCIIKLYVVYVPRYKPREQLSVMFSLTDWQSTKQGGSKFIEFKFFPSLKISIYRVQNFAHNISIPMDKNKIKGVGG
jgi:hypothetical protein